MKPQKIQSSGFKLVDVTIYVLPDSNRVEPYLLAGTRLEMELGSSDCILVVKCCYSLMFRQDSQNFSIIIIENW